MTPKTFFAETAPAGTWLLAGLLIGCLLPRASSDEALAADSAFTAFQRWSLDYRIAEQKNEKLLEEGRVVAQRRRAVLAVLIQTDPEAALRAALSEEVRKLLPDELAPYLEIRVAGTGRYEVSTLVRDAAEGERCFVQRFATVNGRKYRAFVYGKRLMERSVTSQRLEGIALDGDVALADLDASEVGLDPAFDAWTHGEKSALLMRVAFPDDPGETISKDDAVALFTQVNAFLMENSHGAMSLQTVVTPLLSLSHEKAWYCTIKDEGDRLAAVLGDARGAAAVAGYNADQFDLDFAHLSEDVLGPWAYIGAKGATLDNASVGSTVHEIGHNLGLYHASGWATSDGSIIGPGKTVVYGDPFDVMGRGQSELRPFSSYEKRLLGWLPDSRICDVRDSGSYRLYASDSPRTNEEGPRALRLPKDGARDYWIETLSSFSAGSAPPAILLRWTPCYRGSSGTELLDATPGSDGGFFDAEFPIGRPFYDDALGIKIVPESRGTSAPPSINLSIRQVRYCAAPVISLRSGVATFMIETSGPGNFLVWLRCSGSGRIALSIDHQPPFGTLLKPTGGAWKWQRFSATSSAADLPVNVWLEKGAHQFELTSLDGVTTDGLLLTDDSDSMLPPVFTPIPNQITQDSRPVTVHFRVFAVGSAAPARVRATSSNHSVVPEENLRITGDDSYYTLTARPGAGLGSAVITLAAISADGLSASRQFQLSVVSELQRLIQLASAGEIIQVPDGTNAGPLVIDKRLVLLGAQASQTVIDGGSRAPVLTLTTNADLTLCNVTVRNGYGGILNEGTLHLLGCVITSNTKVGAGAGVFNSPAAVLSMNRCTVSSNVGYADGAGIYNGGWAALANCTLAGNASLGSGGAILNRGDLRLQHCTIAYNHALRGGGIANFTNVLIESCIIAENNLTEEEKAANQSQDLSGTYNSIVTSLIGSSGGYVIYPVSVQNLLGVSARLSPLAVNGGSTPTLALLPDSPAIGGAGTSCTLYDQRGIRRGMDDPGRGFVTGPPDMGAYEFIAQPANEMGILDIHFESKIAPTVFLLNGREFSWRIEASSDLSVWHRLASVGPGNLAAGLFDVESRVSAARYYRARVENRDKGD